MAVTKTVSADIVGQAVAVGQTLFGENRLQEAWRKIPQVKAPESSWHLIGPLQSNKVRRAVEIFQVIQTLDRPKIARKINHYANKMGKCPSDRNVIRSVRILTMGFCGGCY